MQYRHYLIFAVLCIFAAGYPGTHPLQIIHDTYARDIRPLPALPTIPDPIPVIRADSIPPTVTGEGALIIDLPTWTVVTERRSRERFYPASTTKMVTALTASRLMKPSDIVTVKNATDEGQIMDLQIGERLTVENLLYGILVHSANDAAWALATAQTSYADFVREMNVTAKSIGMHDSYFTNPAGLDEPDMRTTPYDLALAARTVLHDPLLHKMVSVKSITVLDEDYRFAHELTNVNQLLGVIPGLGGVKTGTTEGAGQNLVSYYKAPDSGHEYLIVVMKSQDRFKDTESIVKWLQTSLTYIDMNQPDDL